MVAVVGLAQLVEGLLHCKFLFLCQPIYSLLEIGFYLLLCEPAECCVFRHHADHFQVVDLAEDAQLGELRDARDEHETEVWVAVLQRGIERAHKLTHLCQPLFVVEHVEQRSVVLVENHDCFLAIFLMAFDNNVLKTFAQVTCNGWNTIFFFNRSKIIFKDI